MTRKRPSSTGIVLGLLCLMYLITYVDRVNVATAGDAIRHELNLTNTQLGFVFSAFAYPYLLFQVFGGWVGDRFGPRLTLFVCGAIWAAATILTGLVGSLMALFLVRVLLGVGEGATFPVATRAMQDWTPPSRRGFAQGITHAFARFGNALTPPIVAWLIALVTWRGSFVALGCCSLAWVAVWGWYFRDNPADHPGITREELDRLPARRAAAAARPTVPWGPLTRRMMPVTIVYFCYGWTLWLYLSWLPLFFLHEYHLNIAKSAIFSSAVFFAGVAGDLLGGTISDAVLKRTGDVLKARRNVIVAGFLGSFFFLLPIFIDPRAHADRAVPGGGVLLRRDRDRTDVVDPDGHRGPLLGHRRRADEHRLGTRGDPLAAGVRVHHRFDRQLAPAVHRIGGTAAARRRAVVHDAPGEDVRK